MEEVSSQVTSLTLAFAVTDHLDPPETPGRIPRLALWAPGRTLPSAGEPTLAPPRVKPRWRGVSHLIAAFIAAPAVVLLWFAVQGATLRLGVAIYGLSLVALFATSALCHRPTWQPRMRDRVGRLDQAAIFLFIAGTYTPFGLLLGPTNGSALLVVMWAVAFGGVILSLVWPTAPKPLMAGIYVAFGWLSATLIPSLLRAAGATVLGLILLGAVAYTLGAVIYSLQRPDPLPKVFGYHEVFHLLVVAAAACHFAAVSLALRSM